MHGYTPVYTYIYREREIERERERERDAVFFGHACTLALQATGFHGVGYIHAQCVVEQSQVSPMSVEPISVFSNSFFECVFACPVAHGSEGGRAAQSSTEGWAWQVLGRARQSRAAERAELDRAGQGKGSAGAGQGKASQSRGWPVSTQVSARQGRAG